MAQALRENVVGGETASSSSSGGERSEIQVPEDQARRGTHPQATLVFFDDFEGDPEAEAGAGGSLGGEEGSKTRTTVSGDMPCRCRRR